MSFAGTGLLLNSNCPFQEVRFHAKKWFEMERGEFEKGRVDWRRQALEAKWRLHLQEFDNYEGASSLTSYRYSKPTEVRFIFDKVNLMQPLRKTMLQTQSGYRRATGDHPNRLVISQNALELR